MKRNIHTPHRRVGNTPVFMKLEVSASFLYKNPQYKVLFGRCPACNKMSFKPFENGRKCWKCGYLNRPN